MEVYNMSGYYEWQRQQANERVAARLAEAEAHRQAKMGQDNGEPSIRPRLLFPALFGILIVILLLNGCAPNVTPTGNVDAAFIEVPTMTMAERIEFQDTRDITFEYDEGEPPADNQAVPWTMADRIEFHDSILEMNR